MADMVLGLDLGLSEDPSALCVLERTPAGYDVRALDRWPLRTPYATIARDVAALTSRDELRGCDLVVDETGVGRPVVEMVRAAGPKCGRVAPVCITAGHGWGEPAPGQYRVAKVLLISTLQALLGRRRLRLPAAHPGTTVLLKEIEDYRVKITASGNEVFSAREGAHDDILLSLGLACFFAEVRPPLNPESIGMPKQVSPFAAAGSPFRGAPARWRVQKW